MTNWKNAALAATEGTRLGAILRCALGLNDNRLPRFSGKASVTVDGYMLADYTDGEGLLHIGAFVGSKNDYIVNIARLAAHLALEGDDLEAMIAVFHDWIGVDYSLREKGKDRPSS